MKKILYITPHLSTGGLPQYLVKKIELLKDIFDIYVVEYADIGGMEFVVQKNKVRELLSPDKFFTLAENKWELIRILYDIRPDIVHIEEIPEFFMDDKLAEIIYDDRRTYFIVETSHDSSFDVSSKRFFPDKFFFVSNWQIEQYKDIDIPKVLIDYPIEFIERPNRDTALKYLGLDPNKKHILHVGLFTPRKNQKEFFEYARRMPNLEFHCVGNQAGNFKNYWEPLMKDKPANLTWWGERKDVEVFYQSMDLFLFTSRGTDRDKETMPLVLKEALSYQIPIMMYNLEVYLGYFDKFKHVYYLEDSITENEKQIYRIFGNQVEENIKTVGVEFNREENKIYFKKLVDRTLEYDVIIKDYLSNHTLYWKRLIINDGHWMMPTPPNYFKTISNYNNFKGYKIDFIIPNTDIVAFTQEIIVDEHATNYTPTLKQNPYNCSYINYVEFFVKKYFDDYNIKETDVFIDVGANDGLVIEWAKTKGFRKYYAVEPDPRAIKFLKEKFIDDMKVVIVEKALYSENKIGVRFNTNNDSSTVTALDVLPKDHPTPQDNHFLSETITFSRLISDYRIDDISVMKIDIEGAEYDLLKSMTRQEIDMVSHYIIECHWLNKEKIDILFNIFGDETKYHMVIRDHTANNELVDKKEIYNRSMITMFITNKNKVKDISIDEPKIEIRHMLTNPSEERQQKSMKSIRDLSDFGEYNFMFNSPYDKTPPKETCHRPNDLADNPGGNNLTSRHYGCYKSHIDAIMDCKAEDNTIYLFFECDAVLVVPPEEFIDEVKKAYEISKKYGYYFFSFGSLRDIDNEYPTHYDSKRMIEAHAYMIPGEKIRYVQQQIKELKWDVFDLWVSYVFPKHRIGFTKKPLSHQAVGVSSIDKQYSDKNYMGVDKV